MRRLAIPLAIFFAAVAAHGADLAIAPSLSAVGRALAGGPGGTGFRISHVAGGALRDVRVTVTANPPIKDLGTYVVSAGPCSGDTCKFDIAPNASVVVGAYGTMPATAGRVVFTATIIAADDEDASNNSTQTAIDVVEAPNLNFEIGGFYSYQRFDPEEKIDVVFSVRNLGSKAATEVVLTAELTDGTRVLSQIGTSVFSCGDLDARPLVCRAGAVPPGSAPIRLRILTPPRYGGGAMRIEARLRAAEENYSPGERRASVDLLILPFFRVANTDDEGPGSLRQAILDANAAQCPSYEGCTIGFRIPGPLPRSGFFTITPATPLPPLAVRAHVKGTAQENYLDLAPAAPLILLDGSRLESGNGLTLRTDAKVSAVAIGNFPGAGVQIERGLETTTLSRLYVGVDPLGNAAPNGRGIIDLATTNAIAINDSVISANRRSGVTVAVRSAQLKSNRIGVAPGSDQPMPNGASGVFLPGTGDVGMFDNVVAHHPHFGVALHASAQRNVSIAQNSIFDNGGNAIDYGLDGATENVDDDSRRFPNHPTIRSARYDPALDRTIVEVHLETRSRPPLMSSAPPGYFLNGWGSAMVELYVNGSAGRSVERFVARKEAGSVFLDRASSFDVTFTIDGDLRSQWLTALAGRRRTDCFAEVCRYSTETSEVSEAFELPSP